MPHSGLIPAHDAVKIQDMLDKMHSDLSHVLVLTKRIGARFEDYKNIYHEVNPWLNILRDNAKQNLDIAPVLIDVVKSHGLLQSNVSRSGFVDSAVFWQIVPRETRGIIDMPSVKDKGVLNMKFFLLGVSILTFIFSLLILRFDVFFVSSEARTSNDFIFGRIFNSLDHPGSVWSVSLKKEFGGRLQLSKPVVAGDVIMSVQSVIDGVSGIPSELDTYAEFHQLSQTARIMLCLVFSKLRADETDPFFLLWKAVGVHPIPDIRWVKHKGLFSLPFTPTGVAEIDAYLEDGHARVAESFLFAKQHHLNRQYGLTEPELKWAYIFLHAFGCEVDRGQKIIVPPLIFARHAMDGVTVRRNSAIEVVAASDMEKGSEIFLNGSDYISDVWTLLFQGSWVADDSMHRIRNFDSEYPEWFSNEIRDKEKWRIDRDLNESKKMVSFLKKKISYSLSSNEFIDRLVFVQFHLVLAELGFAQKRLAQLQLALIEAPSSL